MWNRQIIILNQHTGKVKQPMRNGKPTEKPENKQMRKWEPEDRKTGTTK